LFSFFHRGLMFLGANFFFFLQRFSLPTDHKLQKDQDLIRTLLTTVLGVYYH
jgi:hypothetical protein